MLPGSEPASGSVCAKQAFFSPRNSGSRYFSFISPCSRVENAARGRTGNALAASRDGDGARELFPHHGAREGRHAAAAIVRRHVELPDAELLGASLEALEILRLELFARGGLALPP